MSDQIREEFTLDLIQWGPWLEKAVDTDISDDKKQRVTAKIGGAPNSDYIAVLANDYEAWQARAAVHVHVFTDEEPANIARRELGATTTSRINGCVFCASVHARIYAVKSGNRDVIETFLRDGVDAELPSPEREIVDVATKVTRNPEGLSSADLEPLRALGFDDKAVLDVINYASFFANANRLMLTLGGPISRREWHG